MIPVGNGGYSNGYYWTQTLKELTIYIDVPVKLKARDLKIAIASKHLKVEYPSNQVIIDGELEFNVRIDESMWILNSSNDYDAQIVITLDKVQKTWWKYAIVGDPEIDTSKVSIVYRLF